MYPRTTIELNGNAALALETTSAVVIDDDESMCEGCRQTLEENGFRTEVSNDGPEGLRLVENVRPNVVLVDLKMPGLSGIEVLKKIPEIDPGIVTIVITGYGTIDAAVESMKIGAFDFLTKPFEPEKLIDSVRRGMKLSQLRHESGVSQEGHQVHDETPEEERLGKKDVLLKGLSALGECYAAGLDRSDFLDELKWLEAEAKYHAENLGEVKKRERAILDIVNELRLVDDIIGKYNYTKSSLIQILLETQLRLRWLPRHILKWISERLNIPLGEIYTIATFYKAFSLEPQGAHTVRVCMGTACHVRGAPNLLREVSALLDMGEGKAHTNKSVSLKEVHCLGCCALSPVIQVDDTTMSNPSFGRLKDVFNALEQKEELI